MPLSPEDAAALVSTIDVLSTEVSGLRAAMINADRRARWARSVAIVGVVVGIIGVVVGLGGVLVGADAQRTADDIEISRREASTSSCIQQNVQTFRTRSALVAGVSVLAQPTDPPRSHAAQERVDEFVRTYTDSVEQKLPYRDCSPEGIKNYLKSPPPDPNRGN